MRKRILALSLSLVMLMILVLPVNVNAASGSLDIGTTVQSSISLVVPNNFTFQDIQTGRTYASDAKTVTVDTNSTDWTLSAIEAGSSPDGKMSGPAGSLKNALKIKGGDQTDYAPLSSDVILKAGSTTGETTIDNIYFEQQIATNEAAGTYTITVTFTAQVDF
jgi:hypothetical protein